MYLYDLMDPLLILPEDRPTGNFPVGVPCADSRKIRNGDLFFCIDGTQKCGASYLEEAIHAGASAVVIDVNSPASSSLDHARAGIPVLRVSDVRAAYTGAWSRLTGKPQQAFRIAAVTGTNGKTSVMTFLSELLQANGRTVGTVGTTGYFDGKETTPAAYTTPPPDMLFPLFSRMQKNGVTDVVMEASSHALAQKRLETLSFEVGIFTNLTHDHLDYHKTKEAYRDAKASLFRSCERALLNGDDSAARDMAFACAGEVYFISQKDRSAEFFFHELHTDGTNTKLILEYFGKPLPIEIPLAGGFPVENACTAIAAALLLGMPAKGIIQAAKTLMPPRGRLEKLPMDTGFSVYIDYAHTPDAMEKALLALRPLTSRLTVLFGAGGDRDREKRPEMGHIAERFADRVILTSDNSRSESPESIIRDIASGMSTMTPIQIPDRRMAITYALQTACAGEILLLAGKGHETTITDNTGTHPFSEAEIVASYLQNKKTKTDHIQ